MVNIRHMKELIKKALNARKAAYAPYSKFKVGAAVETGSGRIYCGCNVENASYGLAICAERVAICNAVANGEKMFKRIVVATDSDILTPPCGACRQFLAEFNLKLEIIIANRGGKVKKYNLSKLFPNPFSKENMA